MQPKGTGTDAGQRASAPGSPTTPGDPLNARPDPGPRGPQLGRRILAAQIGAAALSGAALAAVFPSLNWSGLAWVALMPLLLVLATCRSAGRGLGFGYIAGVVFFGFSCPWIAATVHRYGDLPSAATALAFCLFVLLTGSFLALFGWGAVWLGRLSGHRFWPLPFLWVAIEWLRTYTPMGGFPWNLLGYAQVRNAGLMRIAPIAGVYGVSLVIAAANVLAAYLALRLWGWMRQEQRTEANERRGAVLSAAAAGTGLAAILAFAYLPYRPPTLPTPKLAARLVQSNASVSTVWTADRLADFLQNQLALSIGNRPVNLIVWPEQPAPLNYALEPTFQGMTAELLSQTRAAFLFGEVSYPLEENGLPDYAQPRNSAQLINPNGTTGPRYDKRHLVPFGEYVPLPEWFQHLAGVGKMVQGVGDFVPGQRTVLFPLAGYRFGTMICYESIFPALARQEVADGAEWLVNQSDDSWYGNSSAAAQGLMMARMRAIENRRWLLRDTDNGITAVIDPYGRVTARLTRNVAAALDAHFSARTGLTFYTRHGDWLALVCAVIIGLLALYGFGRAATRTPGTGRQGA